MSQNNPPNFRACFPEAHQFILEETGFPAAPVTDELVVEARYSLISPGTESTLGVVVDWSKLGSAGE